MIVVNQDQLDQIQYLIQQSQQGNHFLFDFSVLKDAFSAPIPKGTLLTDTQSHLEKMIALPTISQKRSYVERLDLETRNALIQIYFNIVENNLFEKSEVRH